MRCLISIIAVIALMAALLIGGSYLLEQRDGVNTLLNGTTLLLRNHSAMLDREGDYKGAIYSTNNPNVSSPRIVGDSSGWSIGKIFATSLRSKVNHRLSQVLRAMGMSLAIGIAAGICTCLLGPILFHACLCCMGFRSRGVAPGSIASSLQRFMGNVESGSCFADYQSLGARGLGSIQLQPIVVASFVVGVSSAIIFLIIFSMNY